MKSHSFPRHVSKHIVFKLVYKNLILDAKYFNYGLMPGECSDFNNTLEYEFSGKLKVDLTMAVILFFHIFTILALFYDI